MKNHRGSDKETTNKEQILANVRNAIIEKPEAMFKDIDLKTDTWKPIKEEDGNAITFVQNFKDKGGIFIYLESEAEFGECLRQLIPQNNWDPLWCTSPKMHELLEKYGINYSTTASKENKQRIVSITTCDFLIAQTGSIMISDNEAGSRKSYAEPDVLLVMAHSYQIVDELKEALRKQKEKLNSHAASQAVFITGPTHTYDIEQELIEGVFGPRQIAVFLIDE